MRPPRAPSAPRSPVVLSRAPISGLRRPGPRGRRRWDLALALLVIAGPAAALGLWARARVDTRDLEDRLVRDSGILFPGPVVRPVHRAPVADGSEAERLARGLPALGAAMDRMGPEGIALLKKLGRGELPPHALPADLRAELDGLRAPLAAVLEGTRAPRAELPALGAAERRGVGTLQVAWVAASALAQRELHERRPGAAATWCADALGLGRDIALQRPGWLGLALDAAAVRALTPACAGVLRAASPADRALLSAQLRSIRDALPSFVDVMRAEGIHTELLVVGQLEEPALFARLSPAARAFLKENEPAEPRTGWMRLVGRDAWRPIRITADEMIAAAALEPREAREGAFAKVLEGTRRWSNVLPQIVAIDPTRYGRRLDAAIRRLDALLLLAAILDHRDQHGSWPGRLEDLAAEGLLTPAELRRLGDTELVGEGASLRIVSPLPAWKDDPPELVLVTAPR